MWGFSAYTLFLKCPHILKIANPYTLEELKASMRHDIDCISEIELIRINAHFLKGWQKCVDEGGQHFQHLMLGYKVRDYFSL